MATYKHLDEEGLSQVWSKATNKFADKETTETELNKKFELPSGGTEGQVLTKTSSGVSWSNNDVNIDLSNKVDNETIEYNQEKLKVKNGGIGIEQMDFELQVRLGVLDISNYSGEEIGSKLEELPLDVQSMVLDLLTDDELSTRSLTDQTYILSGFDTSLKSTFADKISLKNATCQELLTFHDQHPDYLSNMVGKIFPVEITNRGALDFQIVGIDHDDLADSEGKASYSFLSYQIVDSCKQENDNNSGYWGRDNYGPWATSQPYYDLIGQDVKPYVKKITKIYGKPRSSTKNYLDSYIWVPSLAEVATGYTTIPGDNRTGVIIDGTVYDFYSSNQDSVRVKTIDPEIDYKSAATWFLRTVNSTGSHRYGVRVGSAGNPYIVDSPNVEWGLAIGFCI